jgi:hypothetical protein
MKISNSQVKVQNLIWNKMILKGKALTVVFNLWVSKVTLRNAKLRSLKNFLNSVLNRYIDIN